MGIDTNVGVGIGYMVHGQYIMDVFGKKVKAKVRLEDRYDEKTGAKKEPVKVVERPAGYVFTIDGEEAFVENGDEGWPSCEELLELLGDAFKCDVCFVCSSPDTVLADDYLVFGPRIEKVKDGKGGAIGSTDTDPPLLLHSIVDSWQVVLEIGERLKRAGIEPGEPMALTVGGWG